MTYVHAKTSYSFWRHGVRCSPRAWSNRTHSGGRWIGENHRGQLRDVSRQIPLWNSWRGAADWSSVTVCRWTCRHDADLLDDQHGAKRLAWEKALFCDKVRPWTFVAAFPVGCQEPGPRSVARASRSHCFNHLCPLCPLCPLTIIASFFFLLS